MKHSNGVEEQIDEILTTFGLHSIAAFRAGGAAITQQKEAREQIKSLLQSREIESRIDELKYWQHKGTGAIEMFPQQVSDRIKELKEQKEDV